MIRRPAAILAVLTALNLLNYVDRWILAAVLPLLQDDLKIDDGTAGWLSTAFLLGYFVTSPVFGRLADRAVTTGLRGGRRGLMAAGVAVWSGATFASGLAGSAASLLATRAVVGVGEASYATVAPTIIDDMAPPAKKARWLSIFYVAIPIGSALGFAVGGQLGKLGWRAPFYVVGGPGMVAAIACLLLVEPARTSAPREAIDAKKALAALRAIPLYRRVVLGYCAQTFAVGGFGFWAPKFLNRVYGLPVSKGSTVFGAILIVAGAIGTWIGGTITDRRVARAAAPASDERDARIAVRVCAWTSVIAAPLAAACFWAPSATAFFVLAFACEAAIFASTSPVNAAILRAAPVDLRASAMAISIFAIHLLGDLWSPPLLGYAQQALPTAIAMMGVPVAIAVSALVWWAPATSPSSSAGTASPRSSPS